MWYGSDWAKDFEEQFASFYEDIRRKRELRWQNILWKDYPAHEVNVATSGEFTLEASEEDHFDTEVSQRVLSSAAQCSHWIIRRGAQLQAKSFQEAPSDEEESDEE